MEISKRTKAELETAYKRAIQEREQLIVILTSMVSHLKRSINILPDNINFPFKIILETIDHFPSENLDSELPTIKR